MLESTRTGLIPALAFTCATLPITAAWAGHGGFSTSKPAYITLTPAAPAGSSVTPILSVGEVVDGVLFEGLPDGLGLTSRRTHRHHHNHRPRSVDVYVAHEQTTIPFFGARDFQDASVVRLTLGTRGANRAKVIGAEVVISPDLGFKRFCSASMAGPAEGFSSSVFFTGEETDDVTSIPAGAPYGADPALAPDRQAGYAVALDTKTGQTSVLRGMGRLNHENTIALPGYNRIALLTTDDTFNGPSAQLYLYLAANQRQVLRDKGRLYAFQVTHDSNGPVAPADPFNGANDYLDLQPGDDFQGRFIPVPKAIAEGTTSVAPQQALEDWSNANNVFQFIRLEDVAYDKNDPSVVYVADTGRSRVVADPTTGRLVRGPSGTVGFADNGRIFKMVFDAHNPRRVVSFTVLADGDAPLSSVFVPMISPDNIDTSANSLMVQEDRDGAQIWRFDFANGTWASIASVNDPVGESSGIVDASEWFGPGSWLLNVQAHGTNVDEALQPDGTLFKREDGQLMLLTLPGS